MPLSLSLPKLKSEICMQPTLSFNISNKSFSIASHP